MDQKIINRAIEFFKTKDLDAKDNTQIHIYAFCEGYEAATKDILQVVSMIMDCKELLDEAMKE